MPSKIKKVEKRDGTIVEFDQTKIQNAIFKAITAVGEEDGKRAKKLSDKVVQILNRRFKKGETPHVEQIQDIVEEVLILEGLAETAKAYILYREQRRRIREAVKFPEEAVDRIDQYLEKADWEIQENANMAFSLQGLNHYATSYAIKKYWLNKIYPKEIRKANESGDFHLHNLDTLGAYTFFGREVIIAKLNGQIKLVSFKDLYEEIHQSEILLNKRDKAFGKYPEDLYILDKNGWTKVSRVVRKKKEKEMRFIKSEQGRSVIVTDDHPFIIKEKKDAGEKIIAAKKTQEKNHLIYSAYAPGLLKLEKLFSKKYLYLAEELLNRGHQAFFLEGFQWQDFIQNWGGFLGVPGTLSTANWANRLDNKLELSEDFGYLVGIFIAEGNYDSWRLVISSTEEEIINKVRRICAKLGLRAYLRDRGSEKTLSINCSTLKLVFEKIFQIKQGSENKNLPPDILNYNLDFIRGVIAGIIDGNGTWGSEDKDGQYSQIVIRAFSRTMLEQIAILLQFFGIIDRDRVSTKDIGKKNIFQGKEIVQNYPLYRLSFSKKENVNFPSFKYEKAGPARKHWRAEEYGWNKILNSEFTTIADNFIYDISTESQTFLCNSLLVHNCAGWDLYDLLLKGLQGVPGKVESKPAKHFRAVLGQIINFLFTIQGEVAGAVAFSVAPKETIIVKDQKGNISIERIGEFCDRFIEENLVKERGVEYSSIENKNFYTPSFNFEGKVEWKKIKKVIRHKITDPLRLVRTNKGHLRISEGHSVYSLQKHYYLGERGLKAFDFIRKRGMVSSKVFREYYEPKSGCRVSYKKMIGHLKTKELTDTSEGIQGGCVNLISKAKNSLVLYPTKKLQSSKEVKSKNPASNVVTLNKIELPEDDQINLFEIISSNKYLASKFAVVLPKKIVNGIKREIQEKTSLKSLSLSLKKARSYIWSLLNFGIIDFPIYKKFIKTSFKGVKLKAKRACDKGIPFVIKGKLLENFLKMIAWYISEGNKIANSQITISQTHPEKKKEIEKILQETKEAAYFLREREGGKTEYVIGGTFGFLINHLCGKHARNKQIPSFVFNLSRKLKEIFIQELLKGDGYKKEMNLIYTTTSNLLATGLNLLLTELGKRVSIKTRHEENFERKRKRYWIRYDIIIHQNKETILSFGDLGSAVVLDNNPFPTQSLYEYDLSVEDNENFIGGVGLFGLHNSNFDTLLSPFIRYDNLNYQQVKQALQEFLFNMATPTRVGFQCPFSNITLDLKPSPIFARQPVIIGGKPQKEVYGEFEEEMKVFDKALYENYMEGDAKGRPFHFPIPTINITKNFPWREPAFNGVFEVSAKYGTNYFANYISSEMKPEDVRSMCLASDEEILIRNSKKIMRASIKEVAESYKEGNFDKEGWANCKEEGNLEVLSLNPKNLKLEWSPVKRFLKIVDTNGIEITIEDGKKAVFSLKHPMAIYTSEGIRMKFAKDVKIGEKILIVNSIKRLQKIGNLKEKLKVEEVLPKAITKIKIKKSKKLKEFYDLELKRNHLFVHSLGQISFNCCRLRLDLRNLYNRGGGGLFGSGSLTGSIGVVTIGLPRLGYLSKTKKDFFERLARLMDLGKESLEIKRKTIENFIEKGLYPYSRFYLQGIKKMRGQYYTNYFSTIGLVGMNEACLNFLGENIASKRGRKFASEILDFMRERLVKYQKETGNIYNLEQTPAESSLAPNENVLISQSDPRLTKIGPLIDGYFERNKEKIQIVGKSKVLPLPGGELYTYGFSRNNQKIKKYPVTSLIRHPGDSMYEINTVSGRKVKVTKHHSVFTLNKRGLPQEVRVESLNRGDVIAVPKKIEMENQYFEFNLVEEFKKSSLKDRLYLKLPLDFLKKLIEKRKIKKWAENHYPLDWSTIKSSFRKRGVIPFKLISDLNLSLDKGILTRSKIFYPKSKNTHSIKALVPCNNSLGFIMGMILAEGWIGEDRIEINNTNKKIIKETISKVKEIFGPKSYCLSLKKDKRKYKPLSVLTIDKMVTIFLKEILGMKGQSDQKSLPNFVYSTSDDFVQGLLKGFLMGDGSEYLEKEKSDCNFRLYSNSKKLIEGLNILLLKLGILTKFRVEKKHKYNLEWKRNYLLKISGIENLSKFYHLVLEKEFKRNFKNSGWGRLPGIMRSLREVIKRYKINTKTLTELGIHKSGFNRCVRENVITSHYLKEILEKLEKKITDPLILNLEDLVSGDLYWDPIKSIKKVKTPKYVYDFEVNANGDLVENFLGGQGLICLHNTSYRLALKDKERYPDIITAGTKKVPFYTNSSQLPVNYTDDVFEALELQDELTCKYTGGSVFHIFLGERMSGAEPVKKLVRKIFENFHLPYITITPTFSVCPAHGYLIGEHFFCPKCTIKQPCEVYSRIVGYVRPLSQWHVGKLTEYHQRKTFKLKKKDIEI